MGQKGFWDLERRQQELTHKRPLLKLLNDWIPWDQFVPILQSCSTKERKSTAGRKSYDLVLMFKLLILQQLYNLSDEELEYQVKDRYSFLEFVGLGLEDRVPDATTLWLFRERLKEAQVIDDLFAQFDAYLQSKGYVAKAGQIIDASLVAVPKQRNSKADNQTLKQGQVPESWSNCPERLRQKDQDAKWTQKNGVNSYGYKNHICIDNQFKLIRQYAVTPANVHDSQAFAAVLDPNNQDSQVWADSAYRSVFCEAVLNLLGFDSRIHQRSYRGKALTEQDIEQNRAFSKIRARVEHIFGAMAISLGGTLCRLIGLERVSTWVGLKNLTYNMCRFIFLEKSQILNL